MAVRRHLPPADADAQVDHERRARLERADLQLRVQDLDARGLGHVRPGDSLGTRGLEPRLHGLAQGTLTASFFRVRSTFCVLSGTPGSGVSASRTPLIRAQATAAPGMMLSRVRRRELPTVRAYPFSKGSATSRP